MAEDPISHLEQRLLEDDDLRERFRQSPHDVLEEHGVSLSEDQSQRLHEADLASKSHDELKATLQNDGLRAMF